MSLRIKTALAALTAFLSISAQADLITNGSFEANDVDAINLNGGKTWEVFDSIDGWSTFDGAGIEIQTNDTIGRVDTPFGDQYIELDSHNVFGTGADTNSFMVQEIADLTTGSYYELSYWYIPRTKTDGDNGINVYWWADGDAVSDSAVTEATADSSWYKGIDWQEITVTLQATASTMYLGFEAFGFDNSLGGFIDNVSLVEVPEPATLGLLAIGLFGLGAARRTSTKRS